jgi:sulfur carrier protein
MLLEVNGEKIDAPEGANVAMLLDLLKINRERVAVEVNMDIVPKAKYDQHLLSDGDKIEIVQFVGGG